MNQFSNINPERIRYWILNNIHMVWGEIKRLQEIEEIVSSRPSKNILRITFYLDSYPIVMQWSRTQSIFELKIGTTEEKDCYISSEMWLVDSNFSSIHTFADWVRNVK